MKILVVQDYLRSGGTERQSVLLANAFAAAGHATTLLTFRPGGPLAPTVASAVARTTLQPFDLGLDWFAPALSVRVDALAPDLVLCMGRMANCHAATLAARRPTVATMRTGKNLPFLFRRGLRAAAHIVANSHDARATLITRYALPAEKISVIHNSLVFPAESVAPLTPAASAGAATPPSRLSLRTAHAATAATTILLSVAMFRPEKNQRELIELVAALPPTADWQLWLAGDGPARPACEALVARLNLSARVRFLGFHRDPTPLYAAADVAVHASWSEALSNFLIEAQAHGLPAVAYDAQGIRECFVPDQTGWAIARDDRAAFRAALTRLLATPTSERTALAAAARTYARTTFDPTRQVTAYLDLFAHLIASSR